MSETENENPTTDEQAPEAPAAGEETSPEAPAADASSDAPSEHTEQPAATETEVPPVGGETSPEAPAADASSEVPSEPTEQPPATETEAPPAAAERPAERPKSRKRLPRSERHKHSKPKRERPAERRPITRVPKPESTRGRRQERRGVVVSSTMDRTIVVKVDTIKSHPRYKKVVRRSLKFHAHDPENKANVGDIVRIVETRPISKTKNWRLAEIVEAAK
jgi:small subunit ribosomal protein S17